MSVSSEFMVHKMTFRLGAGGIEVRLNNGPWKQVVEDSDLDVAIWPRLRGSMGGPLLSQIDRETWDRVALAEMRALAKKRPTLAGLKLERTKWEIAHEAIKKMGDAPPVVAWAHGKTVDSFGGLIAAVEELAKRN